MYFKTVEIRGVGPIEGLKFDFPFSGGRPKPVIVVGENGSGKSILLSYLVNALVVGKQEVYEDGEIEKGKVYKLRHPGYITIGKNYSYASVEIGNGIKIQEMQLPVAKSSFEQQYGSKPEEDAWARISPNETSVFYSEFAGDLAATESLFSNQCNLYFPVNRFEEPAWLNVDNLRFKPGYSDLKHISGYSNRNIVCVSPLRNNKNWLLDVILDRQAFEIATREVVLPSAVPGQVSMPLQIFSGYEGKSTNIYQAVISLLKVILREEGNVRLGVGTRKSRQISVMKDNKPLVPNLFQLSTGEIQLLNLFLSIIRDYDLSNGDLNDLGDIKGIVIVDEIDSHLHASHQREVLPKLISSFPNVQFVITTHSPLFLLGLEQVLGEGNYSIYNMPSGMQMAATDFSEFNAAYDAFKETTKYRDDVRQELERQAKPILFVEGDYDIRYIRRAAELLGQADKLDLVQLKEAGGFGNLDKIWKSYDNSLSEVLPQKMMLLYDCDTNKQESVRGLVYKRVVPSILHNPIRIGIENLFSEKTIEKVELEKPQFIDVQEPSVRRTRGELIDIPGGRSVNRDEKGNMCNWLCENGLEEDFSSFEVVFRIIDELVSV